MGHYWGRNLDHAWEPTPPRPGSLDDCQARGFDTDSLRHDNATPEPLDDVWQAALDGAVNQARHLREDVCHIPECGLIFCGTCGERVMCTGSEPATNTCAAHDDECVDCNGTNPCRDCATTRRTA